MQILLLKGLFGNCFANKYKKMFDDRINKNEEMDMANGNSFVCIIFSF